MHAVLQMHSCLQFNVLDNSNTDNHFIMQQNIYQIKKNLTDMLDGKKCHLPEQFVGLFISLASVCSSVFSTDSEANGSFR